MIKCKNCGSGTRFDIEKQCLVCDYCDSTFNVLDFSQADIQAEQHKMEAIVHTCPQCGAELYTTDDTAATFCSYCGSSVLLESRMAEVNMPDFIIPFKITRQQAEEAYKKKLSRALFAPRSIKDAEIKQMRPIYMPYWEYYMAENTDVTFKYRTNSRNKGGYTYTDVYELTMNVDLESDGLEFDASAKLPDDLSQAYAPYYFKESKLFNPAYMSGFYADLGDVPSDKYSNQAKNIVKKAVSQEIFNQCHLSKYNVTSSVINDNLNINNVVSGMAMYPVWFACAQDKTGKYVNYAAVNGQSGKVAADLPIDKKRIIIGTFILAIPIFLILYLLFTPSPISTLIVIAVLSIVGTVIGFGKAKNIDVTNSKSSKKEKTQDLHNKKNLARVKKYMGLRLLASLILCVALILLKPVHDYFYYGGAILAGILCGFTYWKLFELHNRAIERPLPQLDKRGGEE